jgi:hypothetical protein
MTTESSIDVRRARAELVSTINAIEYKLNVPKRARRAARVLRQEHPVAFAAAGVAAVAAVGAVVWFGVSVIRRR